MASAEPLVPPKSDTSAGDWAVLGGEGAAPRVVAVEPSSFETESGRPNRVRSPSSTLQVPAQRQVSGTSAQVPSLTSSTGLRRAPLSFGLVEVAGLNDLAARVEGEAEDASGRTGKRLCGLALRSLGAVGVVYGDIGTSPLYTLSSIYGEGEEPERDDLMGSASCLVWTLTIVVVVKYILCVMRADHEGEGGIFALLLNVPKPVSRSLVVMAVIGASMLIGDGMITPAMSVLSALEGLATGPFEGKGLEPLIVPGTIVCLLLLFGVQPFGINKIGRAFGPVMVVYFFAVAGIGVNNILRNQRWEVFEALNPLWIFKFFVTGRFSGWSAFWKLGSVVLSVTGAEALFADLGHFGRKPIVISWFCLVYPSLVLGYLGQAAFLLDSPGLVKQAFWSSVPGSVYAPMMVLVTLATIIASQSLIAGCYSLVDQAVVLGLFPRVKTVHTDKSNRGQIFIPEVAASLCVGTIAMVLIFRASANMAGAYGIAVTSTFLMTSLLYFAVLRRAWGWGLLPALAVVLPLCCVDFVFLFANVPKVVGGGWVPLAVGLLLTGLMLTWQWGQGEVKDAAAHCEVTLRGRPAVSPRDRADSSASAASWGRGARPRHVMEVAGVFMLEEPLPLTPEPSPSSGPSCPALECLARSTSALPRLCLLLAVDFQRDVPHVPEAERLQVVPWHGGCEEDQGTLTFYARVLVGFAEPLADLSIERLLEPALQILQAELRRLGPAPSAMKAAAAASFPCDQQGPEGDGQLPVRYFVSQYQYRTSSRSGPWRRLLIQLFRAMNLCCRGIVTFLDLPLDKVFLVGTILEL